MKKLLVIISFLDFHSAVVSQNIAVSADKNNVLYVGIDNPISIAVENYTSDKIVVKADKGTVSGYGKNYVYTASEPGGISIILYKKSNLEEIGRSNFRVKYLPDPVPKVGPSGGGKIQAVVLKSQRYLRAELENFDFDVRYNIDSFTLNVIRPDTCFFKEVINIGGKFGSAVIDALSIIKKEDIVIFKTIYAIGFDGRRRLLSPIVFTLTD